MIPHPFYDAPWVANGTDCSTIANLLAVGCDAGRCMVHKCRDGFRVAADGASCERANGVVALRARAPFVLTNEFQN
jgi:hypothetical protein